MYPFWNDVVFPVIEAAAARRVVEVGALRGENTEQMLERLGPDVEFHVIDPLPAFDPAGHEARFAGRYFFHRDLSVNVLGELPPMDVALIDGDHNWYTVVTELRLLAGVSAAAGAPLPVCICHDVGWPYGRRDLYYDPDTIPAEHRHPWRRAGIRRGQSELVESGGVNAELANAEHEGGPRNGVLTGVEDFVAGHDRPLRLVVLPPYFGLAILVEEALLAERPGLAAVLDRLEAPAGKDMLLRLGEEIRLDGADFDQVMLRERGRRIGGLTRRYLDTVKAAIVNDHHLEMEARVHHLAKVTRKGSQPNDAVLADPARNASDVIRGLQERHRLGGGADDALVGPSFAAGGRDGLDRLHRYLDGVWERDVPGDVATCGAGQGGATLFLAAFLEAHDQDPRPARQRPLWVLDRFLRSAGGADLNVLRDRLARFGLLGGRVRLLQGDPGATAAELAERQLAVLHLGPGLGTDAPALLELLYPRVASGGVVVAESLEPAVAEAIEDHRRRHGVTAPLERDGAGGLAWCKDEAVVGAPVAAPEPRPGASRAPLVRPPGLVPPDLSVIMVVHDMRREARRSLQSLTRRYQQGLDGTRYEVIVVENGSAPGERLGAQMVEGFGRPFRYIDMGADATPSPVAAMNRGLAESRGRAVALMVDGAHVLTPGVLRHGLAGLDAYEPAIVATQPWYVGPGQQGDVMRAGYDQAVEDALFEQTGWPADGYRLFEIGHFAGDRDWFDGLWESNCLFVPRNLVEQVGGFDEAFAMAGGGYCNLDLYERLASAPGVRVVTILGEGSFHQLHGGTTTNQADPAERRARIRSYVDHYVQVRGRPFMGPEKPIHYVGGFTTEAAKRCRARRMTAKAFEVDPALEGDDGPAPASPVPVADDLRDGFTSAYHRSLAWCDTRWLGRPVPNAPTDLVAYQEILAEVRPDWVIDTGSRDGGRPWFLASLCDLLDHGEVISIAERRAADLPTHPRIRYLTAPPHEPAARHLVDEIVGERPRALVILGTRTRRDRTRREFEAFAPLVPVGSYVIVEHTVLNGFPVDASFGPGPHEALRRLLNLHGEFLADTTRERHALTFNQGGFLRRIS
ncbi:MAG TPA: CmcI family methyltransferase [Acidimicrobiales bacterium]|nr:CmcI family methyltransferase [Acidimicrobiales bacterium]